MVNLFSIECRNHFWFGKLSRRVSGNLRHSIIAIHFLTGPKNTAFRITIPPRLRFLLQADANLTAHFAPLDYRLEIIASEGGTVGRDGVYPLHHKLQSLPFRKMVIIFESWQGESIENYLRLIVIELSQDLNLTASFQPNQYSLALNGNEGGTIIGAGDYFHGSTATMQPAASRI